MKKVGIMTFQHSCNFGAQLQAYALREYITKLGFEVDFISYCPTCIKKGYSIISTLRSKNPKTVFKNCLLAPSRLADKRKFLEFEKVYLGVSKQPFDTQEELYHELKRYDAIIVGSDQIWNDEITGKTTSYYLPFDLQAAKISYAGSYGKFPLDSFQINCSKKWLSAFTGVAVRELNASEFLNSMGVQAECCLDPVFLLSREEWLHRIRGDKIPPKDYLFLYTLSLNKSLVNSAKEKAKEYGCELYYAYPFGSLFYLNCGKSIGAIDPLQFIGLINSARSVFTDSFHAFAFSVLLNKEVNLLFDGKLRSRLDSLVSLLGLEGAEPYIGVQNFDLADMPTSVQFGKRVDVSKKFLDTILVANLV